MEGRVATDIEGADTLLTEVNIVGDSNRSGSAYVHGALSGGLVGEFKIVADINRSVAADNDVTFAVVGFQIAVYGKRAAIHCKHSGRRPVGSALNGQIALTCDRIPVEDVDRGSVAVDILVAELFVGPGPQRIGHSPVEDRIPVAVTGAAIPKVQRCVGCAAQRKNKRHYKNQSFTHNNPPSKKLI